jgi:putative SOS response-associated peptidase YedK
LPPDCHRESCRAFSFGSYLRRRIPALLAERDFEPWLRGEAGVEVLKPAPNNLLQKWTVSKRVSSSKADKEDATLIESIGQEAKTLL